MSLSRWIMSVTSVATLSFAVADVAAQEAKKAAAEVLEAPAAVSTKAFDPRFDAPPKDAPETQWWRDSMKTRDERIQWWRDARFGMFIHWGVYSTLGGTWKGEPVQGYAEHIQRRLKISCKDYREEVATQFNPVNFNADEWVRMARDAGIGYLIITSKHHDGFAMWDSKVSDLNVVKATPWKRDPMKDLKAACDKYGVKFGFYYSQAFDWGEENGAGNDWDYQNPGGDKKLGGEKWWESHPEWLAKTQKYVDGKAIPQLQELIAMYDPALIWFDTPAKLPQSQNYQLLKATRLAGPNVVINSRCVAPLADYASTADRPAEFPPHDGDWEAIPTTNESYGYNQNDHSHKSVTHFVQLIAKAAAKGGNLMLNFGPRGDGTFDPADVKILNGIADWMKVNGTSIHGTVRTPLAVQAWGESTVKGQNLYLHVFNWPTNGKLTVGGLKSDVARAYLMSDTAKTPLKVSRVSPTDVTVAIPAKAPDAADSVIVLESAGSIEADASRLLSPTQANSLHVFDGKLNGKTFKYGQGKQINAFIEQWSNPEETVSWTVRVLEPTTFKASASYDATAAQAGSTFDVLLDEAAALSGAVTEGKEAMSSLGTLTLQPGEHVLRVKPTKSTAAQFVSFRGLNLTPIGR